MYVIGHHDKSIQISPREVFWSLVPTILHDFPVFA